MSKPIIGFAGLTHLGLNSAVAAAERGFSIVCFDDNPELIQQLKQGKLPVVEPELPDLFKKNREKLAFTANAAELKSCDLVYIAIDVPTNDLGQSDLTPVNALVNKVTQYLSHKALLVILCQVPPGFTRKLENGLSRDRVFYQVETLIFGRAVDRALNPERFIIGAYDPKKPLPAEYHTFLSSFNCPILPMRYESAELTKIAINCCLVASIGVANTLSEICENIGADWSEIVPALKLDKRIGPHAYLAPGLGLAGGNLERDLTTVVELSRAEGTDARIVQAWQQNSLYRRDWVLRVLHQYILRNVSDPLIAVWGLAYKENTHSTKNSPSLWLLQSLKEYRVKVYDPVIKSVDFELNHCASALNAAYEADILIIMTPWEEFKKVEANTLLATLKGRYVIDPFSIFKSDLMQKMEVRHFSLGSLEKAFEV